MFLELAHVPTRVIFHSMGKHASALTAQELSVAGARAGAQAVAEAHAVGLAVTGYARKPNGELWLARLLPDGAYEWLELVPDLEETFCGAVPSTAENRSFPGQDDLLNDGLAPSSRSNIA